MKRFFLAALFFPAVAGFGCPTEKERPAVEAALFSLPNVETSTVTVDYVSYLSPPNAPETCFVVVSLSDQGDCHPCGATISLYDLARAGGKWTATAGGKVALSLGSFGKAPKPELFDLNGPALRFDVQGMHFGDVGETLVFVAKVDGRFAEVLDLPVHGDNSGSGEDESWSWTATPTFLPNPGGFPEIQVISTGTDKPSDRIVPVHRKELYRFYEGKYVLEGLDGKTPPDK